MNNSKLIQALTDFAKGNKVESFGGVKTQIRHSTIWNKLERVWNNGMGNISFAQMDKGTLIINSMPCTKKEVKNIESGLTLAKIPFEVVYYGYPDYYSKGLTQMRK